MFIRHSYDTRFIKMMDHFRSKYGEKMMELSGVGTKDLDINAFSKKFFKNRGSTADATIDANANVSDKSVLSWENELAKPIRKLNCMYMLWKSAMEKHGIKRANKMIEAEIRGSIKIHDAHMWNRPYSYYQETPIIIRVNGGQPLSISMKHLFDKYQEFVKVEVDRETIDLTKVFKNVSFGNELPVYGIDRHRYPTYPWDTNFSVNEKQYIEVYDDGQWTRITQVLRHKRDTEMVAYETKNGDFSIVTDNHPIILEDKQEIQASELKVGDKIWSHVPSISYQEYIDVSDDIAYLIGFVLGDGNVDRHRFYSPSNTLTDSDVAIVAAKLQTGITIYQKNIQSSKIYQVLTRLFKDDGSFINANERITVESTRITFSSRNFKLLLSKYFNLDYGQCSFLKNTPINILSWNKNAKLQYIIGLMDAEGSIREDGFVTIRMGSYGVISNIREILTSIGIESKVRICGKNTEFTLFFGVSFNANEYIVQNSEKFQRLDDVNLRVIDDKSIKGRNIRDNSVSKIFNIKKDYTKISFSGDSLFEYVYDITTESSHFYSNGMIQHNCYAGSMGPLVEKGMPFYDKIKINPPKHFDSYINLSLQYICFSSNVTAGAVGLPDFFVYLDYYVRKDYGEDWQTKIDVVEHIKQQFQSWIYSVNFSWRSNQSPFTNLSVMDKYWLHNLFENYVFPDYSTPNFENIMSLQKLFVGEMTRNLKDNPFTFPVMTACFLTDPETNKVKDIEFFDWASTIVAETGLFNIFIDSVTSSLSTCCRLRNDISQASGEFFSSLGSGGVDVGSHRVVTINLPQIAWESNGDKLLFMKMLEWRVELAQDILDIHRETLKKLIENGNLPLYSFGFMNLKKQFSTVGFIGLNEAIELMSEDITTEAGAKIGHDIIGLINSLNSKRTKLDNNIRNVEQIPGEGAAYNLAQKDAELFTDAKKYPLYSNQFIPLSKEVNMIERIKIQGEYDRKTSGGSILHLNLDSNVTTQVAKDLIEFAGSKGVKYFAINYNFAQCTNCGKVHIGKFIKSPCHAADIKSWIRVVGFLTPTNAWAEPRREEYEHRQFYSDAL